MTGRNYGLIQRVGLDCLMVRSARSAPTPCPPVSKAVVCRDPFAQMILKGGKDVAAHIWGEYS